MMLSPRQRSYLRALAHHRRVIVTVGHAGLTDAVLAELENALNHHELMKVRLPGIERDEREALLAQIADRLDAELVQSIGRIGVFYRRGEKPKITLPA